MDNEDGKQTLDYRGNALEVEKSSNKDGEGTFEDRNKAVEDIDTLQKHQISSAVAGT